MKRNDGKYFYTARLMNQALLELLEKKDVEFITVTEIARKAGVNRSTFYLHYDNVYELLLETAEYLTNEFTATFDKDRPLDITEKKNAFLLTREYLEPYLCFCKKYKRVFKLAHKKPELFQNKKIYKKLYDTVLYPAASQFVRNDTERKYVLEFFTQGVVGIINRWINEDCVTEIEDLIKII